MEGIVLSTAYRRFKTSMWLHTAATSTISEVHAKCIGLTTGLPDARNRYWEHFGRIFTEMYGTRRDTPSPRALEQFNELVIGNTRARRSIAFARLACIELRDVEINPDLEKFAFWSNFGQEFEKAWNAQA